MDANGLQLTATNHYRRFSVNKELSGLLTHIKNGFDKKEPIL